MKALLLVAQALTFCAINAHAVQPTDSTPAAPESQPLMPTCQKVVAPASGKFFAQGTNRGVAPQGFVYLSPQLTDIQGVDVSKWQQDVDPFAVKQCGGSFAYVRISAGRLGFNEIAYPSSWGQARAAQLYVGAYHYLTFLPESIEFHTLKPDAPPEQIVSEFVKLGQQQADLFLQRYRVLRRDDLKRNRQARFLPPMVAINDLVGLPAPFSHSKKEWFFATVCAFISDVEKDPTLRGQTLVIFSDPGAYQQRDYAEAPCLQSNTRIFWVQLPSPGAADMPRSPDSPGFDNVRSMCQLPGGGWRCQFHQYTNRGGLPMGSLSDGLDLSRYSGPKSLSDLSAGG